MKEFLINHPATFYGYHNVVGPTGVLSAARPEVATKVGGKYLPRGADHPIFHPHNPKGKFAYVLTDGSEEAELQLAYRGDLVGANFYGVTGYKDLDQDGNYVYSPYINLETPRFPHPERWSTYGLTPEITHQAKNKAEFHTWMLESGMSAMLPNFVVARTNDIPDLGMEMVGRIEEMYAECGLNSKYPVGLMIRSAEADGQYGSGMVRQLLEPQTVINKKGERISIRPRQVIFVPDGKMSEVTNDHVFNDWWSALEQARQFVQTQVRTNVEDRVVMTRLVDLKSSPGQAVVEVNGVSTPLPWNDNYSEPGSSASVGTQAYRINGDPEVQRHYQPITQQWITEIMRRMKQKYGQTKTSINAMYSMDAMIPGDRERELWRQVNADPRLAKKYLNNEGSVCWDGRRYVGEYMPAPWDPAYPKIAEINPRGTNWTIALLAVLQAFREPTVDQLVKLASGDNYQIQTRDSVRLPNGVTRFDENMYDALLDYNARLGENGMFILRMPTVPDAGIISVRMGNRLTHEQIINGALHTLAGVK